MVVESGQLIAHSLTVDLAADVVDARCAEHLQQEYTQPVVDLRQRQGWCQLLTSVGFPDQEPYRDQGQHIRTFLAVMHRQGCSPKGE
jgi:hypothetical protein